MGARNKHCNAADDTKMSTSSSSRAATAQSEFSDYVIGEEFVRLVFHESSPTVTCEAQFTVFVRVGALDPRIRLNASQLRIRSVTVSIDGANKPLDYEYYDLMKRIVTKDGDGYNEVRDLQTYYCNYRARSDGADEGEIEIPVKSALEEIIQKYTPCVDQFTRLVPLVF